MHCELVFRWIRLLSGVVVFALALAGCRLEEQATPTVFEIPASYSGWVVVELNDSTASPLPVVAGKRVVRISPSGFVATSSPQEFGVQHLEFFQVATDGSRVQLEDVSLRPDIGAKVAEMSFGDVIVCCFQTGESTDAGNHRLFEGFYVGRGPSGETAPWPRS